MGVAAPLFLPRWLVHWGAVVLFIFYGITMLWKAQFMSDQVSEELEEVEAGAYTRPLLSSTSAVLATETVQLPSISPKECVR
jgi:putative Ca2+/H+ antiporter (TMEM165/GDT1 family)